MIRIVSEGGTAYRTKFIDENGDDLSSVLGVEYGATITLGTVVTAQCRLAMIEADVTVDRTDFLTKHPISKDYQPVAAIVFRDGCRIDFMEDGAPRVSRPTPES